MTFAELESIALANNPALAEAGAQIRAAQGEWVQTGLYPNPTTGYVGTQVGDRNTAGQQGEYIGQLFILGGKLRLNRAIASQQVQEARQNLQVLRLRVTTDTRLQFLDVVMAQRTVTLTRELVRIGEEGVRAADGLFKAGEVNRVDVLQALIEADQARILLIRAENRYQSAWRSLAAVIGVPDMPVTPLLDDVVGRPSELTWDDSIARIMTMSPELGAANARIGAARWTIERARRQPIPDIDTQLSHQYDNAARENIANIQAIMPVPIFNRNQGNIRRAQAELVAARADYRRIELDLQNRLALAFERYRNALQLADKYAHDILPNAQKSLDLITKGYSEQEFSYLLLLTSQRTYFNVNLSYIDALRELWQSSALIEGLLLSDSLQSDVPPPNY